jgi:hypothetical protein
VNILTVEVRVCKRSPGLSAVELVSVAAVAVSGPHHPQAFIVGMLALEPSHDDRSSEGWGSDAMHQRACCRMVMRFNINKEKEMLMTALAHAFRWNLLISI